MKFIDEFDIELVNQALNFDTNDCHIEGGCDLFTTKPVGTDRKLYKTIDKHLDQLIEENELSKSFERRYSLSVTPPNAKGWIWDRRRSSATNTRPVLTNIVEGESIAGANHRFTGRSMSVGSNPNSNEPYMSPTSLGPSDPNTVEAPIIVDEMAIDESPFGPLKETASRRTFAYLIAILNATYPDHDFTNLQPSDFLKTNPSDLISKLDNTLIALGQSPKDWIWDTINGHMDMQDSKVYSFNPSEPYLEDEPGTLWSMKWFIFNKKRKRVAFLYLDAIRLSSPQVNNVNLNLRDDMINYNDEGEYDLTYSDDEMRDVDIVGDLELE